MSEEDCTKMHCISYANEYIYCTRLKTSDFDCKNCKYKMNFDNTKKENNNGENASSE